MGLIRAAKDAVGSMLADQWREYFYCDSLSDDVLMVKGQKRTNGNNKGVDNIISNGSVIAVNEGQCMIIVDQGGVVEFSADPGEFVFDSSTEPSIFSGSLGSSVTDTFKTMVRRFTAAGDTMKDQRVYFFNIKEIKGNLYGTATPIPFRVVDNKIGLDVDTVLRCNGEYTYKLIDPLLFYKNVAGNKKDSFPRAELTGIMKSEMLTALQPALAKVSAIGVRPSEIPGHISELVDFLNEELSDKWTQLRGIQVVSMTMNPPSIPEEDRKMINDMQRTAVLTNPGMAAATLTAAQADAMRAAAANESTGPMMAFAGMNMANMAGGMDANALYRMNAQNQQRNAQPQTDAQNRTGGQNQMQPPVLGWVCSCGKTDNRGKFCAECGAKKPAGAPMYQCDKCGWEPEDPANPPKFCPECGDIFDENDRK